MVCRLTFSGCCVSLLSLLFLLVVAGCYCRFDYQLLLVIVGCCLVVVVVCAWVLLIVVGCGCRSCWWLLSVLALTCWLCAFGS